VVHGDPQTPRQKKPQTGGGQIGGGVPAPREITGAYLGGKECQNIQEERGREKGLLVLDRQYHKIKKNIKRRLPLVWVLALKKGEGGYGAKTWFFQGTGG